MFQGGFWKQVTDYNTFVKPERASVRRTKQRKTNVHLLGVVPFAVKFAVPQKASVVQRAAAHRAAHARLVPQCPAHPEQEPLCDGTAAPRTHRRVPRLHLWINTGQPGSNRYLFVFVMVTYPHDMRRNSPMWLNVVVRLE